LTSSGSGAGDFLSLRPTRGVPRINCRKGFMKKLILRIALGVVILVIVALVVVFFSLNSIVKRGVETVGPKLTQVDMRLKAAELSPLSGNGRLTGLFVGNPQGYQTPSAIQVGDIKVGLQISSVMSDTLVVDQVNIQAPELTFE